jgi:superfamily II helicase
MPGWRANVSAAGSGSTRSCPRSLGRLHETRATNSWMMTRSQRSAKCEKSAGSFVGFETKRENSRYASRRAVQQQPRHGDASDDRFRMTLKYEARDIAYAEQHRATELKRAITLLDERKAKLLTELDEAVSASARLDSYQPIIDDTYQCPVCWIEKSEQSPLVPSARSSDDDSYRCRLCEHEVNHEI